MEHWAVQGSWTGKSLCLLNWPVWNLEWSVLTWLPTDDCTTSLFVCVACKLSELLADIFSGLENWFKLVSDKVWVSASCSFAPWVELAKWLTSNKNRPLLVSVKGMVLPVRRTNIVCISVSMMAPSALKRVFERRNGVDPGTMAILSNKPSMGITIACSLLSVCWFPKRKTIWHLHLLTWSFTVGSRLAKNSVTWLLPITVLVAPRSTTPRLPWVAKNTWASVTWVGLGWASDCCARSCSRFLHSAWSLWSSILGGVEVLLGLALFHALRELASLFRGLSSVVWTCESTHTSCGCVTSNVGPSALGSSKNSRLKAEPASLLTTWANVVGAWGGLDAAASLRWGHSAFQCPGFRHMRQILFMIRCCSDFRELEWPLLNLPFTDLPFDLPFAMGQNPRDFTLSLRRRLASA